MTAIDGRMRSPLSTRQPAVLPETEGDVPRLSWPSTIGGAVQTIVDDFVNPGARWSCRPRRRHRVRCADGLRRRRQVPAVDVHVPGLAVRRRRRRRGAASRRQFRVAACVRAAAGRRDGRLGGTSGPALGPRAVRAMAPSTRRLSGSPERFGESAAVLLGDLCLVWAEQMLRESGVDRDGAVAGLAPIRRDAHRAGGRTVRRSGQRRRRVPHLGQGARRVAAQVRQLHRAAAPGDRREPWPDAASTC